MQAAFQDPNTALAEASCWCCITFKPCLAVQEVTGACNTLRFAPGGGTKVCAAPDTTSKSKLAALQSSGCTL